MKKQFQELRLQQTEAQLTSWQAACLAARPPAGWVQTIREALGISIAAFARHLKMSPAGVRKLEKSEAEEVITLASLRKLAQALDCELQYALVPRTSLKQHLQNRALLVARERLHPVAHSMALEDQSVNSTLNNRQLELLAKEILEGSRRDMW